MEYIKVSLGSAKKIRLGLFRSCIIKKLNLGEMLEFCIYLNAYRLSNSIKVLNKLLEISLLNEMLFLSIKEKKKILGEIIAFNALNKKQRKRQSKKSEDEDNGKWLYSLFVFFAKNFGFDKDRVLSLYPDEIKHWIEAFDKSRAADLNYLCGVIHYPKTALEKINKLNETGSVDDTNVLSVKEMEKRWLNISKR